MQLMCKNLLFWVFILFGFAFSICFEIGLDLEVLFALTEKSYGERQSKLSKAKMSVTFDNCQHYQKVHKGPFQYDVIIVKWVCNLKMLNFWWQWWQVGGWWGLTTLFVCPFFELLEIKKNVSFLPEKNNNFFLYLFNAFFLFCFRQKKTSFPFAC